MIFKKYFENSGFIAATLYSMPDQILAQSIVNIKNGEYCTSFGCCPHVIFPIYYFSSKEKVQKIILLLTHQYWRGLQYIFCVYICTIQNTCMYLEVFVQSRDTNLN